MSVSEEQKKYKKIVK